MSKIYHCCISFKGALENWQHMTVTEDGKERPATYKEVEAAVKDAIKKGYDVLPLCDYVDERGYCKGHEETEN